MKTCSECGKSKDESEFHWADKQHRYRFSRCKACHAGRHRKWKDENRERFKELNRESQARVYTRLKLELVQAYGGKCSCCGETDVHFLTIEHKNGVPEHHKRNGRRVNGHVMLRLIKEEGYPPDYDVLCMNCNHSRGKYGFCPHQPHDPVQRRYP